MYENAINLNNILNTFRAQANSNYFTDLLQFTSVHTCCAELLPPFCNKIIKTLADQASLASTHSILSLSFASHLISSYCCEKNINEHNFTSLHVYIITRLSIRKENDEEEGNISLTQNPKRPFAKEESFYVCLHINLRKKIQIIFFMSTCIRE